ncbi:chrysanthemyl diphosphate synthase [Tanacetum coccineum]
MTMTTIKYLIATRSPNSAPSTVVRTSVKEPENIGILVYQLYDRGDSDGSVGYSFSSCEVEESDGDVLPNPISDVDIPTSSDQFRTPDDALTASAQAILSRSLRKSSHRNIYLKCFITWISQSLRKKIRGQNGYRVQLQASLVIFDDIMDVSHTLRSRSYWFRLPEVSVTVVNDGHMLRNHVHRMLKKHVHEMAYYVHLVDLFNETLFFKIACALLMFGENLDDHVLAKVILIEMVVLQFGDEGGVECLPTSIIFEEIARMGYEKLSQKLIFYKAFFNSNTTTYHHSNTNNNINTNPTSTNNISPAITTTKQRVRKPRRRNTKVTQPSEPEMVVDEDVPIESNDPPSDDLAGNEVVVESEAASKDENLNEDEVTLAQTLQKLKNTTPKAKGVAIREREQGHTQSTVIPKQKTMDKGKAMMIEEHVKLKKKDQIAYDAEVAQKLQEQLHAELEEEARVEREKEEEASNAALMEEWDSIKARLDADAQLAKRLQAKERE